VEVEVVDLPIAIALTLAELGELEVLELQHNQLMLEFL
jgi:hypothetical protein|tara:strand:+ start:58 stop:171 length:114 start_codon:yes stop_codon:yes gene_type:complete